MRTIEAYERDVLMQQEFLKKFRPQKPLTKNIQKNTIFTGSGDSLVSAMLGESFSNFQARSLDPLDLAKNKLLTKDKTVYFVSISGNTISNIRAARNSKKSIAITSKPQSRLAKVCDQVIILQSPNSDVFTAGSISFLESALTCISLVSQIIIPKNIDIFKVAFSEALRAKFGKRIFILGNLDTFPIAMYCAAKFYELLGYDAHYERIEQFSHMELFSGKKGDTVIIFEKENSHNAQLTKQLKKIGINVIFPHMKFKNKIATLIFYIYFSQLLPLLEAKRLGKKDCNFVLSKKLRAVSDTMIY